MAIDYQRIDSRYLRQTVEFPRDEKPGSIVVDPAGYHLYFVESPRVATRYGVGVGREAVSYTHLDVYKRQAAVTPRSTGSTATTTLSAALSLSVRGGADLSSMAETGTSRHRDGGARP